MTLSIKTYTITASSGLKLTAPIVSNKKWNVFDAFIYKKQLRKAKDSINQLQALELAGSNQIHKKQNCDAVI